MPTHNKIDRVGQRFGKLTVLRDTSMRGFNGTVIWLCQCDCGQKRCMPGDSIKNRISCGCLSYEHLLVHGDCAGGETGRLYRIHQGMIQRCKAIGGLPNYGGRGIRIYHKWKDYKVFRDWSVTHGYAQGLTIDRIDNDKGYYPGNCQWLTSSENSRKGNK